MTIKTAIRKLYRYQGINPFPSWKIPYCFIEGLTNPRKGQKEFNVATGKVKWFNRQKGYGFIIPDEGEKDLFVHHSNIDGEGFRSLEDGQTVEFEVQDGTKGPEAIKVRPL